MKTWPISCTVVKVPIPKNLTLSDDIFTMFVAIVVVMTLICNMSLAISEMSVHLVLLLWYYCQSLAKPIPIENAVDLNSVYYNGEISIVTVDLYLIVLAFAVINNGILYHCLIDLFNICAWLFTAYHRNTTSMSTRVRIHQSLFTGIIVMWMCE